MRPTPTEEHNVAVIWARAVVDALAEAGLRHVFVSPGSRSTPLVSAVVDDPRITDHSVIDERSAAFCALGAAQASGEPTALICTSGTAAANYYPAICEADRARVPLLILTADRPPTLRESGSSQSMRQVGLYADHVRWAHDVAMPADDSDSLRYVRAIGRRAHAIAVDEAGPVHLNFPFQKPLQPTGPGTAASGPTFVWPDRGGTRGAIYQRSLRVPDPVAVTDLVRRLEAASRPLILVGSTRNGAEWARVLDDVARRIGAPILAEATSQLRFGPSHQSVVAADVVLSNAELAGTLRPDLVVRLGLPPIDWPVIRWYDSLDAERIVVHPSHDIDPSHDADAYFVCDELAFLDALRRRLPSQARPSQWRREVQEHAERAALWIDRQMKDAPLVDALVAHQLVAALPDDAALFVSSSMPLRELEAFALPCEKSLRVFCNRGLNGIDGVISTAFGVATASDRPTALLIGDVATAHDLAALQLASRLQQPVTIVVIDNGGGAIFDHLPVAGMQPMYDRHFVTAPGLAWAGIEPLFGVPVTQVTERSELRGALDESLAAGVTNVVVVKTDRAESKRFRDTVLSEFPAEDHNG